MLFDQTKVFDLFFGCFFGHHEDFYPKFLTCGSLGRRV